MNTRQSNNRKGVLKTAIILGTVALAFYVGFILFGALNQ